jgi:chromate reductase
MAKVLTICGSLRAKSYNAALIRALPALAPEGMSFVAAPRVDTLPHYNHDDQEKTGFPPAVTAFADAIRAADAVMIVSPEYNWTIPGTLKNAIDWVSRMKEQPFRDKPVALQSASGALLGGSRMQYHLRQCLISLDALTFGRPEVIVTFAPQKFDEASGELKDQTTRDMIKLQLAAFAGFVKKVSGREEKPSP